MQYIYNKLLISRGMQNDVNVGEIMLNYQPSNLSFWVFSFFHEMAHKAHSNVDKFSNGGFSKKWYDLSGCLVGKKEDCDFLVKNAILENSANRVYSLDDCANDNSPVDKIVSSSKYNTTVNDWSVFFYDLEMSTMKKLAGFFHNMYGVVTKPHHHKVTIHVKESTENSFFCEHFNNMSLEFRMVTEDVAYWMTHAYIACEFHAFPKQKKDILYQQKSVNKVNLLEEYNLVPKYSLALMKKYIK